MPLFLLASMAEMAPRGCRVVHAPKSSPLGQAFRAPKGWHVGGSISIGGQDHDFICKDDKSGPQKPDEKGCLKDKATSIACRNKKPTTIEQWICCIGRAIEQYPFSEELPSLQDFQEIDSGAVPGTKAARDAWKSYKNATTFSALVFTLSVNFYLSGGAKLAADKTPTEFASMKEAAEAEFRQKLLAANSSYAVPTPGHTAMNRYMAALELRKVCQEFVDMFALKQHVSDVVDTAASIKDQVGSMLSNWSTTIQAAVAPVVTPTPAPTSTGGAANRSLFGLAGRSRFPGVPVGCKVPHHAYGPGGHPLHIPDGYYEAGETTLPSGEEVPFFCKGTAPSIPKPTTPNPFQPHLQTQCLKDKTTSLACKNGNPTTTDQLFCCLQRLVDLYKPFFYLVIDDSDFALIDANKRPAGKNVGKNWKAVSTYGIKAMNLINNFMKSPGAAPYKSEWIVAMPDVPKSMVPAMVAKSYVPIYAGGDRAITFALPELMGFINDAVDHGMSRAQVLYNFGVMMSQFSDSFKASLSSPVNLPAPSVVPFPNPLLDHDMPSPQPTGEAGNRSLRGLGEPVSSSTWLGLIGVGLAIYLLTEK